MKISIVVIAHNEAGNIARCLRSVQRQILKPDEVVVVAHNCTDGTAEIAKEILNSAVQQNQVDGTSTKLIELSGPEGIVLARVRGFEEAQGEIVACIDGDSVATTNWLHNLIKPFSDPKILAVGGGVWLTGGLIPSLMSLDFFWLKPIYSPNRFKYFWGANFAIRKSVYEKIGGLIPFIQLNQELGLSLAPEDLYLALRVSEVGELAIEPWAVVVSQATKTNWKIRSQIQGQDKQKLIKYIKDNPWPV